MSADAVDVLSTARNTKNGALSAQLGDSVNGETTADGAEWFQHVGFASRPSRAEPGKPSCQALVVETTGRDVCYASRDLRGSLAYGELGEGESCVYANGPNNTGTGVIAARDDGTTATLELLVKRGNSSGGAAVRVIVSSDGSVTVESGAASVVVDGVTGAVAVHGTSVTLGSSGGAPVVVDPGTLTAWLTTVSTALSGLGVPVTPPAGILSTKVTAS
jgi:hypothetical protein